MKTVAHKGKKVNPKRAKGLRIMKLQGLKWSELPKVEDMQSFPEIDPRCICGIYNILKKYKLQDRLGIAMLHKHFELADDEFLLETTDVQKRTQLIRPARKEDYAGQNGKSASATIVKLVEGGSGVSMLGCAYCVKYRTHHGHS
jgi:hypothetical protein